MRTMRHLIPIEVKATNGRAKSIKVLIVSLFPSISVKKVFGRAVVKAGFLYNRSNKGQPQPASAGLCCTVSNLNTLLCGGNLQGIILQFNDQFQILVLVFVIQGYSPTHGISIFCKVKIIMVFQII